MAGVSGAVRFRQKKKDVQYDRDETMAPDFFFFFLARPEASTSTVPSHARGKIIFSYKSV